MRVTDQFRGVERGTPARWGPAPWRGGQGGKSGVQRRAEQKDVGGPRPELTQGASYCVTVLGQKTAVSRGKSRWPCLVEHRLSAGWQVV